MKQPSSKIEWIDFIQGRTKVKVDKKGFAHLLVFDGRKVFPVIYNGHRGVFVCGSLYVQHITQFAYMPKVK